jgi:anoctamin-10
MFALLIALAASHGYILLQAAVRHVVERVMWVESAEVAEKEKGEQEVKESYFRSLGGDGGGNGSAGEDVQQKREEEEGEEEKVFWGYDEGLEEIQKLGKEE